MQTRRFHSESSLAARWKFPGKFQTSYKGRHVPGNKGHRRTWNIYCHPQAGPFAEALTRLFRSCREHFRAFTPPG